MTAATRVLGAKPVASSVSALTAERLRVLAFHDVPDAQSFGTVLDVIAERYNTVSGGDVLAWLDGAALPNRPVWITFDDGHPAVVETALGLLSSRGMNATVFVCPGLIDGDQPYWWDLVDEAVHVGVAAGTGLPPAVKEAEDPGAAISYLKDVADDDRREIVAELARGLRSIGATPRAKQLTVAQLRGWIDAGNEIGNHTWDHPCLDRCAESEQRRQVRAAHEWLHDSFVGSTTTFAWPNGNPAAAAASELRALGYRSVLRFDHRLVRRRPDPMDLSRLRLDTTADPWRTRAVLSGLHSTMYHAARRFRRSTNRADA